MEECPFCGVKASDLSDHTCSEATKRYYQDNLVKKEMEKINGEIEELLRKHDEFEEFYRERDKDIEEYEWNHHKRRRENDDHED